MSVLRTVFFAVGVLGSIFSVYASAGRVRSTKIIFHGWDTIDATPSDILANADEFAKLGIDGVTLCLVATSPDGKRLSFDRVMNNPPWAESDFAGQIPVLRKIAQSPSLRESLLSSWWSPPKRLDWTDDVAWGAFAINMGVMAAIARKSGLKGILIDDEDYSKSRQYELMPGEPSYRETCELARKRAREVFSRIFEAYPDITLLAFRLLSREERYLRSADPLGLAESKRDLWPWFVNGMLDVMPESATVVDGNEHAYEYMASRGDFYRSSCERHTAALGLVMPENRYKYRGGVRVSFGLYLDSYICGDKSQFYMGPLFGSRLRHFVENAEQAADAAEGYLWLYGERRAIVPWKNLSPGKKIFAPKGTWQGVATWNDALPGFNEELLYVKDKKAYLPNVLDRMKNAGTLTNLVLATARPWEIWHDDSSKASSFGSDGGAVFIKGPARGCHHVQIDGVKEGERYAIRVKCRGKQAIATVFWKKNGAWRWKKPSFPVVFSDGESRREGYAVATVPSGVDRLVINLAAGLREGETAVFDEVEVYRVEK